jgi:hypothetical protein
MSRVVQHAGAAAGVELLVGTTQGVYAGAAEPRLFASRDRGESWAGVPGPLPRFVPGGSSSADTFVHSIVVDPDDAERLWVAGAGIGVVGSTDGGRTWQSCNDELIQQLDAVGSGRSSRPHQLAIDPQPLHPLYLQHFDAVFRSFDGGQRWQRIDAGLPSAFGFPITVDHTGAVWVAPLTSAAERYGTRLPPMRWTRLASTPAPPPANCSPPPTPVRVGISYPVTHPHHRRQDFAGSCAVTGSSDCWHQREGETP